MLLSVTQASNGIPRNTEPSGWGIGCGHGKEGKGRVSKLQNKYVISCLHAIWEWKRRDIIQVFLSFKIWENTTLSLIIIMIFLITGFSEVCCRIRYIYIYRKWRAETFPNLEFYAPYLFHLLVYGKFFHKHMWPIFFVFLLEHCWLTWVLDPRAVSAKVEAVKPETG